LWNLLAIEDRKHVPNDFPNPTGDKARNQRAESTLGRGARIPVAVRQFFQPCVLAFFALAIAISANGYGYKLSQYLHHAEVSKASGTRMWVEHRNDSSRVGVPHQTKPQLLSGFALIAFCVPQLPRFSRDHVVITPAPARVAFVISSHIPFRAPPALNPSLA
jgi:hypothetical protein